MDQVNIIYCCVFGLSGILTILLNIPLLQGKVKRNYWYGIRIPKSFESEENWMAINRHGARRFIQFSPGFFIMSIITLVLPLTTVFWMLYALPIVLMVMVIIPIIDVILYARKL